MVEKRQRDVPDDADEKWFLAEHSAAKHEILKRYLGAWLTILGRGQKGFRHKQLVLIDGFAGRGRYMKGEPGSPAIMFDRAAHVADAGLVEQVVVSCFEPNRTNFGHLEEVCGQLRHPKVDLRPTQETFEQGARKFVEFAKKQAAPPPTFVMVDPYGVKGVRLDTIRELLSFNRVEVFLTFMVRDPARFMEGFDSALTALFGGTAWRACVGVPDRPECLMRTFQEVVTADVASYALPYKVHEDDKTTVLYYLVHLTNNDRGMRVMKEKMIPKSGEMTFFPITLRPKDQLGLDVAETSPYPTLQAHLSRTYSGRTLNFVDLLNEDYPRGRVWIEGQYSKALQSMERGEPPTATVDRVKPLTQTGQKTRAIGDRDKITFYVPAAQTSLL